MKGYPKRETEPINYGSYVGDSNIYQNHRSMGTNPQNNFQAVMHQQGYDEDQDSGRTSGYFRDK